MFNGKRKAVTFSYDDGVLQDKRLIKILNKYGLKGTFNLNSGCLGRAMTLVRENVSVAACKPLPREVRAVYEGHEVAVHTMSHPALTKLPNGKVIREVEADRLILSDIVGYDVVGMAYPGSEALSCDDRTVRLITEYSGVQYSRCTSSSYSFAPQKDLLRFHPTVHHTEWDKLFSLGEAFLNSTSTEPEVFYIWGHAYEFDIFDDWDRIEAFCQMIAGKDDIFYGTNREILLDEEYLAYAQASTHVFHMKQDSLLTAKKYLLFHKK